MSNLTKIEDISLSKLNNAEFTYFAGQIISFIETGTAEALHVPETVFTAFKANQARLVELVNQSRIAEETAQIAETDKQEDDLLTYIFSAVKNGRNHPIDSKRAAAQTLYNLLKPYTGVQSLPQRQQVQTVEGMLKDLQKVENAACVSALNLDEEVGQLEVLNEDYRNYLAMRAESQTANPAESAKPVRTEMYDQYDELVTTAWAYSIASPSAALSAFVTSVNKLIADTRTAYNLRMGQRNKPE